MPRTKRVAPDAARATTFQHRVAFYETDAMGIVHHSNYVRYLELARVQWLDQTGRPYSHYMERGLHIATTRVELDYHLPARFDDSLEITTWLEAIRGARLRMAYTLLRGTDCLLTGATEHVFIDGEGRPRRIPREDLAALGSLAAGPAAAG